MSKKIKKARNRFRKRDEDLKRKFGKRRDLTEEEIKEIGKFAKDAKYHHSKNEKEDSGGDHDWV